MTRHRTLRALSVLAVMTSASFAKGKTKVLDFTPWGHAIKLTVPDDWRFTPMFEQDLKTQAPPQPLANPSVEAPGQRMTVMLMHEDVKTLDALEKDVTTYQQDVSFTRAEKTSYGWLVVSSDSPMCTVRKREFRVAVYNSSLKEWCGNESGCKSLEEVTPVIAICESMIAAQAK